MTQELSLSIVGSGGDGAVAAGDILSMACAREGLNVIKTEAYGPQIRGGESSCTVRISSSPIYAQADLVGALIVFNWADYGRFRDELTPADNATIFHEAKDTAIPEGLGKVKLVAVPFAEAAREVGAPSGKNIVALGLVAKAFGLPQDALRTAVQQRFRKKTAEVVEGNLKAFDRGVELATQLAPAVTEFKYEKIEPKLVMSGNEAAAVAAIDSGCRFFAGYPITPSSEVLHFLGEWLPKIGGNCLQTEDELAAIGAVVGASFGGVKSMTATSGPGLSLMTEMLGLASMAEVPAVVFNVQRGGPSTGLPTKSEQADLFQAVFAGHGDQPRAVIACSDVEDSYHATVDAFNIAEQYQIPVIILSDQSIAQRRETLSGSSLTHEVKDRRLATPDELEDYKRYRITDTGVSPMSAPGMKGGMYQTNGLEHNEDGSPSAAYSTHEKMNAKRYLKMEALAKEYRLFRRFGPEKADLGIVCWGSSAAPVREAVERLNARGQKVAAFVPQMIMPLPKDALDHFIADCKQLMFVELSFSAQFYKYVRSEVDLPKSTKVFARSGGKPLGVTEVVDQAQHCLVHASAVEEVLA